MVVCGNVGRSVWVSSVGDCDYGRPPGIIKSYYFRFTLVSSFYSSVGPPMLDNSFAIICQNNAGHGFRDPLSLEPVSINYLYTFDASTKFYCATPTPLPLTELSHLSGGKLRIALWSVGQENIC